MSLFDVLNSHDASARAWHALKSKKTLSIAHSARGAWSSSARLFQLLSVSETARSTYSASPFYSRCVTYYHQTWVYMRTVILNQSHDPSSILSPVVESGRHLPGSSLLYRYVSLWISAGPSSNVLSFRLSIYLYSSHRGVFLIQLWALLKFTCFSLRGFSAPCTTVSWIDIWVRGCCLMPHTGCSQVSAPNPLGSSDTPSPPQDLVNKFLLLPFLTSRAFSSHRTPSWSWLDIQVLYTRAPTYASSFIS